jgi:hypothetical protein
MVRAQSVRSLSCGFFNSDPALAQLLLHRCRAYLGVSSDRFLLRLHLHGGQSEKERAILV